MNDDRRVQRSAAVFGFSLAGLFALAIGILFSEMLSLFWVLLFTLIGIALCIAGVVYAVLCRRVCTLTGPGIAGIILSGFGILFGTLLTVVLAVFQIFLA